MHHTCAMTGVAVVLVVVWLHYCGVVCVLCCMMNDDDAGGLLFGWQNVCCAGDGGGTHHSVGKCSVEAHNTAITAQ